MLLMTTVVPACGLDVALVCPLVINTTNDKARYLII